MKLSRLRIICILLLFSLCLSLIAGCRDEAQETVEDPMQTVQDDDPIIIDDPVTQDDTPAVQGEEQFDLLLDELFAKEIVTDSITLNYFLADPSRFGIEPPAPTFGEVTTAETIMKDIEEDRELRERLDTFIYGNLRADQKVIYDLLDRNLKLFEAMGANEDNYYYLSAIHPVSGIQVQLPILLAEYNFRTDEDIEAYLLLLADTQRYFRDLIEFERERSRRGFFMSDANTDEVIDNCKSYLDNRKDNLLIVVFDDKIDHYEGLADEQRELYKQRNRDLVMNNVLVAYEELLDAMQELRGQGANQGGLADLPDGPAYAELYLQYITGSDKTSVEGEALLREELFSSLGTIWEIFDRDSEMMEAYFDDKLGVIPDEEPAEYLKQLEASIVADFPSMKPARYVVHEVQESLQEFLSPAFYLIPAVDRYKDNVIYINPSSVSDSLSLYTTLAHEGYPGHLYQNVYFLQQSPHPLWILVGTTGYTEGWATYVGQWSYYNVGLKTDEATVMQLSYIYSILIMGWVDIGVNALGWGRLGTAAHLRELNINESDTVDEIFNMVTADPLSYLPYCLGYIEILSLLDEAKDSLGSDFDLLEFHRFLLDIGPAPFPLINARMQDWIKEQAAGALAPAA